MSTQLSEWCGPFGEAYTNRNQPSAKQRATGFRTILDGCDPTTIYECGTNRGHNLQALQQLYPTAVVGGCEPAEYARSFARAAGLQVSHRGIHSLPHLRADLALTSGVLIHIPPAHLVAAMSAMHRLAGRWLLAIEYAATHEREVRYHGKDHMLWARPYGTLYQQQHPDLELVRTGTLGEPGDGFSTDDTYWLFRKA